MHQIISPTKTLRNAQEVWIILYNLAYVSLSDTTVIYIFEPRYNV